MCESSLGPTFPFRIMRESLKLPDVILVFLKTCPCNQNPKTDVQTFSVEEGFFLNYCLNQFGKYLNWVFSGGFRSGVTGNVMASVFCPWIFC